MVRRSLILCMCVCLLMSAAMQAHAEVVYSDGMLNSSYVPYFRDLVSKLPMNEDYVLFRSGAYEYKLVSGELEYDGGFFYGSDVKSFIISFPNENSLDAIFISEDIETWDLITSGRLVYSNLGDYPELIERGSHYEAATLILLIVGFIAYFMRSIFRFTLRLRISG